MKHDKVEDFREMLFCNDVYTLQEAKMIAEACIDKICVEGYEVEVYPTAGQTEIIAKKTEVL